MYTQNELCREVNCGKQTLLKYLDRPEFSHIVRKKVGKGIFTYEFVSWYDIEKLKELTNSKYRPNKYEIERRN